MRIFKLYGGIELETSRRWTWTLSWGCVKRWYLLPTIKVMFPNNWCHWWHFEFSFLFIDLTIEKRYKQRPPTLDEIIKEDLRRAYAELDQEVIRQVNEALRK